MKSTITTEMGVNARERLDAKACRATTPVNCARTPSLRARPICDHALSFGRTSHATDSLKARLPYQEAAESAIGPISATASLNAALRAATSLSFLEKVAYAALALGGFVSVATGVLHTERLLAHWPAVIKLLEGILS